MCQLFLRKCCVSSWAKAHEIINLLHCTILYVMFITCLSFKEKTDRGHVELFLHNTSVINFVQWKNYPSALFIQVRCSSHRCRHKRLWCWINWSLGHLAEDLALYCRIPIVMETFELIVVIFVLGKAITARCIISTTTSSTIARYS